MRTLTIDRTKWYRGQGSGNSALKTIINMAKEERYRIPVKDAGKMCCLGFYMSNCGVPDTELSGVLLPHGLGALFPVTEEWLLKPHKPSYIPASVFVSQDAQWETALAVINDDMHLDEKIKELAIARIFKEFGNTEVVFVN